MAYWDITFFVDCQGCNRTLSTDNFEEDGKTVGRCPKCRNKRRKTVNEKQLCEECGCKACFNFETENRGVRCRKHKIKGMINLFSKTQAMKRFIKRISELGGQVIGEYKGSTIPVLCVCSKGHKCNPSPNNICRKRGMCQVCAGQDFETAKQNFINNIQELGGQVIGEYVGAKIPIVCKCSSGHKCNPTPTSIQQGQGMCKICAKNDPETSKQNFIKKIQELGGQVIGEYKKNDIPIECICSKGHKCNPRPCTIQQGQGMCRICVGQDFETSKHHFIDHIKELGGQVIGEYMGSKIPVDCICPNGHKCNPAPTSIKQKQGMCRICAGNDPETSKQNFINRIQELGGRVIGEYKGDSIPINCNCPNGHKCNPSPSSIRNGHGMCPQCIQSGGESLLYSALKNMDLHPTYQAIHHSIPTLKYDYSVLIDNKIIYIEFHGYQHEKFIPFFHKDNDAFLHRRQLDLLKIYVTKKHNIKLIIFDHTWSSKSIGEWTNYLYEVLYDDRLLIADAYFHDWIQNECPLDSYISKYIRE